MIRYMLDTNMVSSLVRKNPIAEERVREVPITSLCISVVVK